MTAHDAAAFVGTFEGRCFVLAAAAIFFIVFCDVLAEYWRD